MLGICTPYRFAEATYAALHLAAAAKQLKIETSMLTIDQRAVRPLDHYWDRQRLVWGNPLFTEWAERCHCVVMVIPPEHKRMLWLRQQGIRVVLVAAWHGLDPEDLLSMSNADCVLCPSSATYEMLRDRGLGNCIRVPWDTMEPLYHKPTDYEITVPRLLLPVWDGNARRTELTSLDLLRVAMARNPTVQATVAYSSSTFAGRSAAKLRRLRREFRGRLSVARPKDLIERTTLFHNHDLTIWPTHAEDYGMIGLQSVLNGTPVLAFEFDPVNEVINSRNGVLVPCRTLRHPYGALQANPDYDAMDHTLFHMLRDLPYLRDLQQTVLLGADQRRKTFLDGLKIALKDCT